MRFASKAVAESQSRTRRRGTARQDQRGGSMSGAFASSADTAIAVVMKQRTVLGLVRELENRFLSCLTTYVKTGVTIMAI